MTDVVVSAQGLLKEFPSGRRTLLDRVRRRPDRRARFRAVDGIDLEIRQGEVFGVLGPNGAGKTTTMRMLATLLLPTAGRAQILGLDVVKDARQVRRRLGTVLGDGRSLYWKLTARENLEYFAALYHVPAAETPARVSLALATVELSDRADDYVERYSMGMRQRLLLARALLPDPPLMLLDEPTVGLDPQSARHVRQVVAAQRELGRTVLLTTHYMEEADQLCDRLAIVDGGRVVALGTPAELKRRVQASEVVRLEVGDNGAIADRVVADLSEIAVLARRDAVDGGVVLTLHCDSARDLVPRAFDAARSAGTSLRHVEVVPVSLEDVFLSLTGRELRD